MSAYLSKGHFALVGSINAASVAKSVATTSSYFDVSKYTKVICSVNYGNLDSGQATLDFLQATDTSGSGSKALSAGNFASSATTTNNAKVTVEEFVNKLDGAGGFDCMAMRITTDAAVATAAIISAQLFGTEADYRTT